MSYQMTHVMVSDVMSVWYDLTFLRREKQLFEA